MATAKCPVAGYEQVEIAYPDQWLVKHHTIFYAGVREAPEDANLGTQWLYGSIALCEKIEGLPVDKPITEWPLELFNWILQTVYFGNFEKALNPQKNS